MPSTRTHKTHQSDAGLAPSRTWKLGHGRSLPFWACPRFSLAFRRSSALCRRSLWPLDAVWLVRRRKGKGDVKAAAPRRGQEPGHYPFKEPDGIFWIYILTAARAATGPDYLAPSWAADPLIRWKRRPIGPRLILISVDAAEDAYYPDSPPYPGTKISLGSVNEAFLPSDVKPGSPITKHVGTHIYNAMVSVAS
uniref:Uncharacterized protein n=1 Tax=Coccidioides posadasii RMSCC 3488 TaxID=454284 RepID=A0A0J6FVE4_COCPO|nr:hypothetical protein CPAG_09709 [Coccidioides posadasii RMSCC 3488]